jgi:23S rRNA (uracil1939-C5)-methyltransferase
MEVTVEKLVHGGQGLATLPDGRKVFVWGALPGERVRLRITKGKRSYAEAIAEEVLEASPVRIAPREENYMATSPWQIIDLAAENDYKQRIVSELFTQAHVPLPEFHITTTAPEWQYRNKMEYSFWGDDTGLHLALYSRGSHRKHIVEGSVLAMPAIDQAAQAMLAALTKAGCRAGDLKTIVVRCSQSGQAAASLFVKTKHFPELSLPEGLQGLRVYFSNPKSPASVATELLYEAGDVHLHDTLLAKSFTYDVDSFFQVNIPVFEAALQRIADHLQASDITDMYAGTGSIGLSVAKQQVNLVEIDPPSAAMARLNAAASGLQATVIETGAEKALEYIRSDQPVIFDPPRAGLHASVTARTLEALPSQVIYLSCNPATQARDLAMLQEVYSISYFEAFNFFPHTPHIETLAILERRQAD